MRRRVVREVGTVAGVAVLLLGLAFTNGALRRNSLADDMIRWRESLEKDQVEQNQMDLLKWPILQATTGGYYSGPSFDDKLKPFHQQGVNLMGFQVPVEQFRDMTEFLLLPMPIECYFCQRPPMRDVVLVQMAKGEVAPLVKEPVLINGTFELHEGPKTSFFYTIRDAKWGPAKPDMKIHRRSVSAQHQMEGQKQAQEPMMEGTAVPKAESVDKIIENAGAPLAPGTPAPVAPAPAPTADGPVNPSSAPGAAVESTAAPAPAPEGAAAPPPQ